MSCCPGVLQLRCLAAPMSSAQGCCCNSCRTSLFFGGGGRPPVPSFCPPFWTLPSQTSFLPSPSTYLPSLLAFQKYTYIKHYLGLPFLGVSNSICIDFFKIYQSKLSSLSHGLPSILGSKTALSTNFKSSAAMVAVQRQRSRGEGPRLTISNHNFEIIGNPSGSTFWLGF